MTLEDGWTNRRMDDGLKGVRLLSLSQVEDGGGEKSGLGSGGHEHRRLDQR